MITFDHVSKTYPNGVKGLVDINLTIPDGEYVSIIGLSGAGKSSAATYLEDMGYYTVDNVPADIILKFAEFCAQSDGRYDRVALVSDIRSGNGNFQGILDAMERLKQGGDICRLLFVTADLETIIKRYKETRRRHPLMTDGMTIELIADGIHLPSTILKLAYKLKGVEHTCLVTDALSCAATEGKAINDPRYIIEDGVCKLADRSSLAGSIATMDVLVRTMVKAGIPLGDALRMASETPARIMGVYDRKGSLQKDKDADILIMDKELNIRAVWQAGKLVQENFLNYK